jgi:hypothetical protein
MDRRDAIYAELGVPPEEPEDSLDRWRRMKAEREEPQPRERKLDIAPPTLAEIDQRIEERIAAEHEFHDRHLGRGPRANSERRGDEGTAGASRAAGRARAARLAMVKLWVPETVYYARATLLPTTAARSRRSATPGSCRRMPTGSASPPPAATAVA